MKTPRRIIKIRMTQRVAQDSTEILKTVAEVFQYENIEIDIDEKILEAAEVASFDNAVEVAKDTLDLQDQAIKQGMTKVEPPEKETKITHQWLKTLGKEGFKVTVQVIFREVAKSVIEHAPAVFKSFLD